MHFTNQIMKENKVLLLIALLAITFISGGILNRTLDHHHFGTIGDLIMIMVTTVTAYYLYETLQSQKTVQRDQEKINSMQALQIRKSFKPEITVSIPVRRAEHCTFSIKIINHPIQSLRIISERYYTILRNEMPKNVDNRFEYFFPKITPDERHLEFTIENIVPSTEISHTIIEFECNFQDQFGFNYSTTITITYSNQTYQTKRSKTPDVYL